jgi:hypothetical protein
MKVQLRKEAPGYTYVDVKVCQLDNVGPQDQENTVADQDLSYEMKI